MAVNFEPSEELLSYLLDQSDARSFRSILFNSIPDVPVRNIDFEVLGLINEVILEDVQTDSNAVNGTDCVFNFPYIILPREPILVNTFQSNDPWTPQPNGLVCGFYLDEFIFIQCPDW